ncbi:aminopeptidase N [Simiduia sp. 21SJ11W-1]|uniref:aminopeptidase N n=1 Tax=Simiduia sp. 21SJ11W-1 TaxID=2909669 RepID=UPI0020A1AF05|nr:aminopeptidase N [Simiduia sp. 21SJ11W-1]UTA49350.1 aminopeptidase N [Simiduia sp. 21SJ11W-1]
MTEQQAPNVIYLADYQPPTHWIDETHLDVDIKPNATRVTARLKIRPNEARGEQTLVLDGENLDTRRVCWNDRALAPADYTIEGSQLILTGISEPGWLTTEVVIDPENNTALEGLYRSRTMYCTQCEAEGFRKITWYLDRPDVMSVFTTRIEADKTTCPVLLSNGNLVEAGEVGSGRHFAAWHDPHKKPSYLFALVAGELACVRDAYTTASGRKVAIEVFVEPKDLDKCDHAIDSLKRAMRWDETVYGREYDLDIYMIVAVDDFNMGAMENKGLNIFNTSCVLANPKTTTDVGFQRVEAVVAHEYFHNWSGNRVTCRDWFQLSLKEGFTVYRDAQFSADMNSATVKRIEDVNLLRTAQFKEDAGPLAHPVRPPSFIEISNFYTLTVYEKGAEVVRMLATLLGPEDFRRATDLYFERHDGQAVTCDDFVQAMEDVSGRDFTQFKLWYSQAGTPEVAVAAHYDENAQQYRLRFSQSCPPTPEADTKAPFHIPVRIALLGDAGQLPLQLKGHTPDDLPADNTEMMLELTEAEQEFTFTGVKEAPVPSLLRGFSAPVNLRYEYTEAELVRLLTGDTDLFNRWSASQELAVSAVKGALQTFDAEHDFAGAITPGDAWVAALAANLEHPELDPAVMAYMLQLPSVSYLHDRLPQADILALHKIREALVAALGRALAVPLSAKLKAYDISQPYAVNAEAVAQRSLSNTALLMLARAGDAEALAQAVRRYQGANNMTDQLAALKAIVAAHPEPVVQAHLNAFYAQWADEALVVNQWLTLQASRDVPQALDDVQALTEHACFSWTNPNKVRALVAGFASQNPGQFHRADGRGYHWLADVIIRLNQANPQLASRLVTPLAQWRKFGERGALMREALARINGQPLSKDVYEVVAKALA